MVYNISDNNPLNRFLRRQKSLYDVAVSELSAGKKRSLWMWYVFPSLNTACTSRKAYIFSLRDVAEAKAYLDHPILGKRLVECCEILLRHKDKTAESIFGRTDVAKLHSCITLFASISDKASVFHKVLEQFFDGKADIDTRRILSVYEQNHNCRIIPFSPDEQGHT